MSVAISRGEVKADTYLPLVYRRQAYQCGNPHKKIRMFDKRAISIGTSCSRVFLHTSREVNPGGLSRFPLVWWPM